MQRWEQDEDEDDTLMTDDHVCAVENNSLTENIPIVNLDLEYGVISLPFICLSMWMIYYGIAGVQAHVHCQYPLPTWLLVGGSILAAEVLTLSLFIGLSQYFQCFHLESVHLAFKVIAVICTFICAAWLAIGTIWLVDLLLNENEKHCSFYGFGWSLVSLGWSIFILALISSICYWISKGPEISATQRFWSLFIAGVQALAFVTLIVIYSYMMYLGLQYTDDEACEYNLPKWLLMGGVFHLFFLLVVAPCVYVHHKGKLDNAKGDIILMLLFLLFCSFTWLLFGSRWVYNIPLIEHHRTCPSAVYHFAWIYLSVVWSMFGVGVILLLGFLCFGKLPSHTPVTEEPPPIPFPTFHPSSYPTPSRLLSHLKTFLPPDVQITRSNSSPHLYPTYQQSVPTSVSCSPVSVVSTLQQTPRTGSESSSFREGIVSQGPNYEFSALSVLRDMEQAPNTAPLSLEDRATHRVQPTPSQRHFPPIKIVIRDVY